MEKKRQFAVNKLLIWFAVMGLFCIYGSYVLSCDNDGEGAVAFGIVGGCFLLIPMIMMPVYYSFDNEGVSLCYLFFSRERYLWKNVDAIEADMFCKRFLPMVFKISGRIEGGPKLYMNGHIINSRRTKKLFEEYWDETITGYFFEDIKKWISEKRNKNRSQIKYDTDEAVRMEREARAELREWIKPFFAEAKQKDLQLITKYSYVTKDFDELNSRPESGYTYTFIVEIAKSGETDENHIFVLETALLYVRLKKNAYRVVKNEKAKEELCSVLSEVLEKF